MSDDDDAVPLTGRRVDISARFVQQAYDHMRAGRLRYVTFLFAGGEHIQDVVCVGISTQALLTDQRPHAARQSEPSASEIAPPATLTIRTLTHETIVAVFKDAPRTALNVRTIGDKLGVASHDTSVRGKIGRLVTEMVTRQQLRIVTKGHFPTYLPIGKAVVSEPKPRGRPKKQVVASSNIEINRDMLLEKLRADHNTSKKLGDALGIDPGDTKVRQRISDHMGLLITEGVVRVVPNQRGEGGGRVYELMPNSPESEAAA